MLGVGEAAEGEALGELVGAEEFACELHPTIAKMATANVDKSQFRIFVCIFSYPSNKVT